MAEPFVLPASKLAPPRIGVALMPRPHLLEEMHRGFSRRLVLLTGEAGYGKTCALISALSGTTHPVAWLTLDERDTDQSLFGAGVVLALRRVAPAVGKRALEVLAGGPNARTIEATLLRCLEDLRGEVILVLDDFHVLDDTPAAQALADSLLTHLPPHVHVAIASRTRPALRSLPRLLVQGQALVLDRTRLAFTLDEATAFLGRAHGLDLDEPRLRAAAERTEGWPAALTLLAQAAERRGLPALEGTPHEVFEYLASVVLEGLPANLREFVLRTSVLFEFTPALSQSVSGAADAEALLAALERRNLFVDRLDESGTRFRYHQLFAEFLRQRLMQVAPDSIFELHVRAGRHLEQTGEGDQAVRHYLLGGAYEEAVRVILPYRAGRLTAQRAYLFRDLVRRLPPAVAEAQPWLLRTAASSCRFIGDYEQALAWSRRALAASRGKDSDLWAHAVHGVIVMLTNLGRLGEARSVAESAVRHAPDGVQPGLRADLYAYLANICRLLGRLKQSVRATEQALRLDAATVSLDTQGQALLNRARLALVRFEPTAALDAFRIVLRRAEEEQSAYYQVAAWAGLAQAHMSLGSLDAAELALQRARTIHHHVGERLLELELAVLEGDLAHLRCEGPVAESHYRRVLRESREGELPTAAVRAHLGLARTAAAAGEDRDALEHARRAVDNARRSDLGSLLPAARLAEASILAAGRQRVPALAALREADATFATWRCPTGRARCAWLQARILTHGAQRRNQRLRTALIRAITSSSRRLPDVLPWLRAEAAWVAPLLIGELTRNGRRAERLLVSLGSGAVGPLLDAVKCRDTRVSAVRVLGAIGDSRARQPLHHLLHEDDGRVREVATRALLTVSRPSPSTVRISLLGRFEVLRDGHAVTDSAWTTQKVKMLFKLLVLHRPAGLHQAQVIEWLWPEQDEARGKASLKTAVKLLRRALEPGLEGTASRILHREGPVLRLSPENIWVDLDEHAYLLAEAHVHAAAGRVDQAIAHFERAQSLYHGDLLDPGDRYEEWVQEIRERVQRAHRDGLTQLSALRASRADYEGAAEAMRRVLAIDPLCESAYRSLMQYARLRGHREEVFAVYAECARRLREELGVEPEPATSELLDDARRVT
jgi:ATP/maltotriose-dependent transcriptional regulator MalT/DNA-binding SARP family transcriptional activator